MPAAWCGPGTPLVAVDGTKFAVGIGPLVPDGHPLLVQPFDIGRTLDEPEQLSNDRPGVQLLRCKQRKALTKVEAHLIAKRAERARAGPVALLDATGEHVIQQVEGSTEEQRHVLQP